MLEADTGAVDLLGEIVELARRGKRPVQSRHDPAHLRGSAVPVLLRAQHAVLRARLRAEALAPAVFDEVGASILRPCDGR